MKTLHQLRNGRGQALITLLFFIIIALTISTAGVALIIANSLSSNKVEQGARVEQLAEAGIENAILRMLRDPSYTGESLNIEEGTVTITVSGTNPYTVNATAKFNNYSRTLQAELIYNNNILTVISWKEI